MRVECPSCKQTVSPALAINAIDVGMTCPSCSAAIGADVLAGAETDDEVATTTPIPVAARTRSVDDIAMTNPIPTTQAKVCAKCGTALRDGAGACASCGLAVSKMATYSEKEIDVGPAIKAAWARVIASWDDEARHDALFRLVAETGEYGWAAARYREQAKSRPDSPIATKQQEKLRRAIEATLIVSATTREKPQAAPYKSTLTMLGVLVIMLIIGMFYLFIKSRGTPAHDDDQPPGATSSGSQVR